MINLSSSSSECLQHDVAKCNVCFLFCFIDNNESLYQHGILSRKIFALFEKKHLAVDLIKVFRFVSFYHYSDSFQMMMIMDSECDSNQEKKIIIIDRFHHSFRRNLSLFSHFWWKKNTSSSLIAVQKIFVFMFSNRFFFFFLEKNDNNKNWFEFHSEILFRNRFFVPSHLILLLCSFFFVI